MAINENIYRNVATEVLMVLNNSTQDIISRIPKELFSKLEKISNKAHKCELDTRKSLSEQKLMNETFDVLTGIYVKYCTSGEVKSNLLKVTSQDLPKEEKIVTQVSDEPLNKEISENTEVVASEEVTALEPVKKDSWIKGFFAKVKSIFKR